MPQGGASRPRVRRQNRRSAKSGAGIAKIGYTKIVEKRKSGEPIMQTIGRRTELPVRPGYDKSTVYRL